MSANRDIVVVHTSDVHVDHEYAARQNNGDGAKPLAVVLAAAKALAADVLLLCGDTFDCHNIPVALVRRVSTMIRDSGVQTVLLPGNHDPAIDEAMWEKGGLLAVENLRILGVTTGESVVFDALGLEVWGRPHRDYGDMNPLEAPPRWRARRRVAMAHGHYDPVPDRSKRPRASWLLGDDEIAATGAEYLALGHWNRAIQVAAAPTPAYYSGSPDYAQTVNVARLRVAGGVDVERHPLDWT